MPHMPRRHLRRYCVTWGSVCRNFIPRGPRRPLKAPPPARGPAFLFGRSCSYRGVPIDAEPTELPDPLPDPGIPESFNVLIHELRGLALDVKFD